MADITVPTVWIALPVFASVFALWMWVGMTIGDRAWKRWVEPWMWDHFRRRMIRRGFDPDEVDQAIADARLRD